MIGSDTNQQSDSEISKTFKKLGLGSVESRSRFLAFSNSQPEIHFEIVISNTSQPFRR